LNNPISILKKAKKVLCLSGAFGGPSCVDQIKGLIDGNFIAECKLNNEAYEESKRLLLAQRTSRLDVLKNIVSVAKQRAKDQPVIIMLDNEGECKKMEKYLVDGFHTFFYDDDNY
jgi:hypothetical protein